MWAILSKEDDKPVWISDNKADLEKSLLDIVNALGARFYMSKYEKDQSDV